MAEIIIEYASIRLLDKLNQIEKQCFKQEAFSKQQIAYLLMDYNSVSFVAYFNNELAGFVIGRIDIETPHSAGHIITLDVAPQYRRKGIAQMLLQEFEDTARQQCAKECRLEVREDNAVALRLYEKLGYKKIAKLENYYSTAHGLQLKKVLA